MTERKTVVDLASFQSHLTVDDYKAIGADYAIIKTTESINYVNPYIRSLIDRSAGGGIKGFAFYHFGRFHNDAQAVAEANYFIANSKAQANVQPGTLMILDAEISNVPTSSVIAFLNTVRNAGYHTGFYTYKYLLPNFNLEAIHPYMDIFWLAAYPLANGKAAGKNPDFNYFPSANYVDMWQHTDNLLGYNVDGSITLTDNAINLFNPSEAPKPEPNKPIEQETPAITTELPSNHWVDDMGDRWFAEKGTFVTDTAINLRWGAKTNSALIATLPANSEVKYDAWSRHDGYVWLRQPRPNNQYGYLVCRDANNNQPFGTFK
ncbi:SH3 domain-containing protein [Limosilactobacillus reuteri]|uniref:GH25 family lysozyme n=1 Tax=Limosilactobacillus reuteri TaxID=1598 RepID=UPI001E29E750|nr:GH25 family lysozyme [Limosilactobacillus reuteri]MCC4325721.1 SH3 domain-containing protein [Limosilactobacillus reuteri]MCC4330794.1 SH3 domain-containing protein [Limosilactobacillus reuteri]